MMDQTAILRIDTIRIASVMQRFFLFSVHFVTFESSVMEKSKAKGLKNMKEHGKRFLFTGCLWMGAFAVWTLLIQTVDVQPLGVQGTRIGFASMNVWFHTLTGVHLEIYHMTDWLGLVPIAVCLIFGGIGFFQMLKRRSLLKVDYDLFLLGIYYLLVIMAYLIFEMVPINYRPILIQGNLESSYPSSTTLLVLCVMPTLTEQLKRRMKNSVITRSICILSSCFSAFMVLGRLICGVHWITDIIGSILFSAGLFYIYQSMVLLCSKDRENRSADHGIS